MKKAIFLLTLVFLVSSCAWLRKEVKKEKEVSPKQEIKKLKDKYKYVEEGGARIKRGDLPTALKKAKEDARGELAKSIRVKVEQIIVDELGSVAKKDYSKFVSRTKFYTDVVLGKPDYTDWFERYPDKHSVTFVMCASEKTVKKWVAEDIETKLKPILTHLNSALKSCTRKEFGPAVTNLLKARDEAEDKFAGMSIGLKIKGEQAFPFSDKMEGQPVEVISFISSKITELIGGIRLIPLDENIVYTAGGIINRNPRIQVVFEEESTDERTPLANLPLRARFATGSGEQQEELTSRWNGLVVLDISYVDPSFRNTIIEVAIDGKKLGIREEDLVTLPVLSVRVPKMQTAVISVIFINGDGTIAIPEFVSNLRNLLASNGYSVIDYSVSGTVTPQDMRRARDELNADYLLSVNLMARTIGPDAFGAYTADIRGEAKMFSLHQETESFTVSCPHARGEHLSKTAACLDAFFRISSSFLREIEQNIRSMGG